jgi:hypothetical protein
MEKELANALADEWLDRMSVVEWADAAASIRRRAPHPCGETTTLSEQGLLFDVSDSWAWVDKEGGDVRLTIEVYLVRDERPLAIGTRVEASGCLPPADIRPLILVVLDLHLLHAVAAGTP